MSNYVPTKQHLREVLLFNFHLKKSAAESHRLLSETYGDYTPSVKTCESWFRRFKNGDYDIEDKERTGQPKKFTDEDLEALIDENPCQTTEELAKALNVTHSAISKRLKTLGIQQKDGNWIRNAK